jgi:leader peptidase (prepilin peptidase)/N-methyltransferase
MAIPLNELIALGVLAGLTSLAALIDLRHLIIPNVVNLAILVSGLGASFFSTTVEPISAVAAVVVGAVMMGTLQLGFRIYRGYDGLGGGDVKFVAASGAWTGIDGLAIALAIAALGGLFYAMARSIFGHKLERSDQIAFAPALGVGAFSVVAMQTESGLPVLDFLLERLGTINF